MKIRHGFVSNSSSSSFVVAFSKLPTSKEIVNEVLFSNVHTIFSPYGDSSWPVSHAIDAIWEQLQN
ncbi:MAG: hypothetical protein Q7R33_05930, partial [Nitrosarchaeum sp.]|nr:hypothetical protein [Nitrosarchaeum sp.]